jgi:sugar lactone lactonase YvrE
MAPSALVRRLLLASLVLLAAILYATPANASSFPSRIDLPDGFRPEGIAIGRGATFYVGSLANGAIYRGDLRTGTGTVINAGSEGAVSVGLAVDQNERVFAAGGPTGQARVIDGRTGALLATYQLTTAETFVNDVVIASGSAWFTDSVNPVLYRVPLDLGPAQVVPLTGDLVYEPGINVNGIEATPDGKTLVLVQTNTGLLFTSDLDGVTSLVDLGGETVDNGDGLLLQGKTLYVVQNMQNVVAVVQLAPDLSKGSIVDLVTNEGFDVPTTIDRFGSRLYVVNARFSTPPTPATPYWITQFTA